MNLYDSIRAGKEKYRKAKENKMLKAILRPVTSTLFIKVFNDQFEKEGFGIPAQITKKDKGMLNHLIKHLSEKLNTQEIVDIAKNLVGRWNEIGEHVFTTVGNRKMTMPTRPNLRAFLYCKNDIVSFLTGEEEVDDDGENPNIMPT